MECPPSTCFDSGCANLLNRPDNTGPHPVPLGFCVYIVGWMYLCVCGCLSVSVGESGGNFLPSHLSSPSPSKKNKRYIPKPREKGVGRNHDIPHYCSVRCNRSHSLDVWMCLWLWVWMSVTEPMMMMTITALSQWREGKATVIAMALPLLGGYILPRHTLFCMVLGYGTVWISVTDALENRQRYKESVLYIFSLCMQSVSRIYARSCAPDLLIVYRFLVPKRDCVCVCGGGDWSGCSLKLIWHVHLAEAEGLGRFASSPILN